MFCTIHSSYMRGNDQVVWQTWASGETHLDDGSITFWNEQRPVMTVAKSVVLNIQRTPQSDIVDSLSKA